MSKPSSKTINRLHSQADQQGLALVSDAQQRHSPDDNNIIKELANMILLNDRDQIFAVAKRLVANEPGTANPLSQLVSVEQVAQNFNLCTRSIWRLVAKGDLPQPIFVGGARRWFSADINAYLAQQTAKRDAKFQKSNRSLAA